MARISKLALFWRAFFVSLIVGAPSSGNKANASEAGDWASAVNQGTFESFVRYLERNPTGAHIEEALAKLVTLARNEAPNAAPGEAAGVAAAAGVAGVAASAGAAASGNASAGLY